MVKDNIDERLSMHNKELIPTKDEDRNLKFADYTLLWAGMTINIAGFSVGAQLYPGLSPYMIILGILVAYGIVTILLALNGDIGIKYGIPFTIYSRACFGHKGSHIAGLIRSLPCFFWFGFQTWVGATALNEIMKILVGYSNLTLLIIIFAGLQIVNALYGLEAMAKFDWIAVPTLAIVLSGMVFWLLKSYSVTLPDILASPADNNLSFVFAVTGIAGGWITMALNAPDLTRQIKRDPNYEELSFFQRNKTAILGQILGLVIVGALVLIAGMVSGILTGIWNPIDVIVDAFQNNTVIVIVSLIAILFAQWSTNTTANLMPPAYILLNIFPKLKFSISTIISGLIGLAIMPWKFSDYLVYIQALSSSLLGPIVGIMLSDYYIIRKTRLDVYALYDNNSVFKYANGFNPAAMITLIVSFVIAMLTGDYAFFTGLILSAVLYPILMKSKLMKNYNTI